MCVCVCVGGGGGGMTRLVGNTSKTNENVTCMCYVYTCMCYVYTCIKST